MFFIVWFGAVGLIVKAYELAEYIGGDFEVIFKILFPLD